jgi:hypothetical protein
MNDKTPYNDLPLVPTMVAMVVVDNAYTGQDISEASRDQKRIAEVEKRRQRMTDPMRQEFIWEVDQRCQDAYDADAKWFKKCLKGDKGRDQLYIWIAHWLHAWLRRAEPKTPAINNRK